MRCRFVSRAAGLLALLVAPSGCRPDLDVRIPTTGDWRDCGPVLEAGGPGDWDHLLYGGFAGSALVKDGRIFLYYQGASGHRQGGDETPTYRAIGLAISEDGFRFEKHATNPVLSWLPNHGPEEGAAAGTAGLDAEGRVVLFYGANTEAGAMQVNADVRVARSDDGIRFRDLGRVLDHASGEVWGSGDELFPVASLRDGPVWIVYYVPNGPVKGEGILGVAWGDTPQALPNTARALGRFGTGVRAWGMASAARVGPDHWALFTNRVHEEGGFEVRLVDARQPRRLGAPLHRYRFSPPVHGTVLLDRDRGRWFLYDRRGDHYGVRIAAMVPARGADDGDDVRCPETP